MVRNVEVSGGYMSGGDDEKSKTSGTFVVKMRENGKPCVEVVPEDKLGAFLSRDWEMCGMPKIMLRNTNKVPTVEI